jgi:gluconate:H+ symporter, GntP family
MYQLLLLLACVIFIVLAGTRLRLHPFLALVGASLLFGLFSGLGMTDILSALTEGFGNTLGKIGLIIVFGMLIGAFLEHSGGALSMAAAVLRMVGVRGINRAMAAIGCLVSIPVFCDSGFIILSPLMKGLAKKAGRSLAGPATALALGLLATHTMVPPTPGPVAATALLGANLGLVIVYGLLVSLPAVMLAVFFMRPIVRANPIEASGEGHGDFTNDQGPGAVHAFLPVLLPILLIVLGSLAGMPESPFGHGRLQEILMIAGNPLMALMAGLAVAMTLPKRFEWTVLSMDGWVGKAIVQGGSILLITGAGGAFGNVLQRSGLGAGFGELLAGTPIGLFAPFLVAVVLKTAQGSSTVALLTASSIVAPALGVLGLESEAGRALAVVAIGAGSCVVSHANDSYFWVVGQFSGMDLRKGYMLLSLGSGVLGFCAMALLYLLSSMML